MICAPCAALCTLEILRGCTRKLLNTNALIAMCTLCTLCTLKTLRVSGENRDCATGCLGLAYEKYGKVGAQGARVHSRAQIKRAKGWAYILGHTLGPFRGRCIAETRNRDSLADSKFSNDGSQKCTLI
ncbi:hypothetical protein SAMN04487991_2857 [Celeribacter neptunius]|uniref:Uncharacterized protein n=1 Tax=Celeribacter neptunius TaxID=588602 RepID=A0A1I3TVX0_9RHOB|nr:hypothetical protein SAMN04487991_2857 [Celeribacter neptunius]